MLLVDGVTKISRMSFSTQEERQAENFRKMIIAMTKDIRVLLIKLTDRLHNMRTIQFHNSEKRKIIAQETLDIYAPLANRLGIDWIKNELEDLTFLVLQPDIYRYLLKKVESKRRELEKYSSAVMKIIDKELKKNGIKARLQNRIKHLYGIHHKMVVQEIGFGEVYDLVAFRVIVDTIKDCYGAMGIIHSMWKPVPGRIKDFIAMPKPNMYQSLHTTVIGPKGERIEIQIRTEDMHKIAEKGIAAHWRYKEMKGQVKQQDQESYDWLKRLFEWQQDVKDPREFIATVKIDLFPEEVYVFTPKGDVKAFPRGATPLDFAYSIHTDIGNTCSGAKVNGKIVPLKYNLQNGDTVEIITSKGQKPSKDWLRLVATSRAKQKIKHWFITEQRERSISLGREILEKEFSKNNLSFQKKQKSKQMNEAMEKLKANSLDELLSKVANAKVTVSEVLEFFIPKEDIKDAVDIEAVQIKEIKKGERARSKSGVLVSGVDDVMVRYAKCCNPLPGDRIVGFISRGRGLTVHNSECSNLLDFPAERLIDVEWDTKDKVGIYTSRIMVSCENKKGVLASVATAISEEDANISNVELTTEDNRANFVFQLEVFDLKHLNKVIKSLGKKKNVISVKRMN
jgi:GTP pyrophosphokinase